jgi:hypothetical protein
MTSGDVLKTLFVSLGSIIETKLFVTGSVLVNFQGII